MIIILFVCGYHWPTSDYQLHSSPVLHVTVSPLSDLPEAAVMAVNLDKDMESSRQPTGQLTTASMSLLLMVFLVSFTDRVHVGITDDKIV